MTTRGLYFPQMSKEEVNQVIAAFSEMAKAYGYVAESGGSKDAGSPGRFLVAITQGKVPMVRPDTPEETKPLMMARVAVDIRRTANEPVIASREFVGEVVTLGAETALVRVPVDLVREVMHGYVDDQDESPE